MQDTPRLTQRPRDNGTARSARQRAGLQPSNPVRDPRKGHSRNPLSTRGQTSRSHLSILYRGHLGISHSNACETPFVSALRAPLFGVLPGRETAPACKRSRSRNSPSFIDFIRREPCALSSPPYCAKPPSPNVMNARRNSRFASRRTSQNSRANALLPRRVIDKVPTQANREKGA